MAVENGAARPIADEPGASECYLGCYLQSFELYETRSNFYMFGSDESRAVWRVLKIDRLEPSELSIREDFTTYTQGECLDLLKRIDEGNKSTGGLKFVTTCYGIIGFVKFLGPYYMLLITDRKQVGAICGHAVYKITKTDIIVLPNSSMQSTLVNNKSENRYKKLLCTIDLTKDFFFSYSYHIMRSLQKNLCDKQKGQTLYETMFVWNEFLTRGIRNHLKNTFWTVALVYGFFKQDKFSISGRDFLLTLIARRSRHYAGTRYLKRGVNEKGRVANDVETEQIVSEEIAGVTSTQISSVVQNRGSIPLFWSQETSKLNLKPDIILHNKDKNYEATRLHFENLVNRYGNPIIILNLIKRRERKPRESLLHGEFDKAIKFLNNSLTEDNHLRFLHWDLHKNSQNKARNVLTVLVKVALQALSLTGFFYCQVVPTLRPNGAPILPVCSKDNVGNYSSDNNSNSDNTDDVDTLGDGSQEDVSLSSDTSGHAIAEDKVENSEICIVKPPKFQNGVVRTNCIDCLDRTNVAQYAYGLAALGHQLHALDIIDVPEIDLDAPLAKYLMCFYERMGDTLAQQYGGSAAHNKIFSARRGHLKLAIQSQEFFRTLQRYYSNAYMDANKQAAINLFLGYFQPQEGKPALWELDSDQHFNLGQDQHFPNKTSRSFIKRSLSDGIILHESSSPLSSCDARVNGVLHSALSDSIEEVSNGMSVSYSRTTPTMPLKQLLMNGEYAFYYEPGDSNFLNLDSLSSSGCEEETCGRSTAASTPVGNLSLENVINGIIVETSPPPSVTGLKGKQSAEILEYGSSQYSTILSEFNESFVNWVIHGDTLCR